MPKDKIISIIDFFYPLFRRVMPLQTFRYAACGGGNTVLAIVVFNLAHAFIFEGDNVELGFVVLKSYNAALFVSFCVSFIVGFLLMKYVVFTASNIKGRIQLFRYLVSYLVNLALSYFLMKIFVEYAGINATVAQLITTVVVIALSYLTQKHFSFGTKKDTSIKL
jgi:putative flippase GtrA